MPSIVGSSHSAGTLRVKEFLTRNGHPHTPTSMSSATPDVQVLLDRFHVGRRTTCRS